MRLPHWYCSRTSITSIGTIAVTFRCHYSTSATSLQYHCHISTLSFAYQCGTHQRCLQYLLSAHRQWTFHCTSSSHYCIHATNFRYSRSTWQFAFGMIIVSIVLEEYTQGLNLNFRCDSRILWASVS